MNLMRSSKINDYPFVMELTPELASNPRWIKIQVLRAGYYLHNPSLNGAGLINAVWEFEQALQRIATGEDDGYVYAVTNISKTGGYRRFVTVRRLRKRSDPPPPKSLGGIL